MQPASMRAIDHWIADDADAVAWFEGILSPAETLQYGGAAGDYIPLGGFTVIIGSKHHRKGGMRIAPVESLHSSLQGECLIYVVRCVRVMCAGRRRH
jgi:hypothetical protein